MSLGIFHPELLRACGGTEAEVGAMVAALWELVLVMVLLV